MWDLLSNSTDPCLIETISGGILTTVSQSPLPLGVDLLAIGDHNGNVRIFKLPKTFTQYSDLDRKRFHEQIEKEVGRKEQLRNWQSKWREDNLDILEGTRKSEEVSRGVSPVKQLLPLDKSQRTKDSGEKAKKKKSLVERSELKWEQKNMKRLMGILMAIKDIDPKECNQKTLPIRQQWAYRNLKRAAIRKEYSKIASDYAEIRSRIMPVKEDIQDRKEVVQKLYRETLYQEEFNPTEFEEAMTAKLQTAKKPQELTLTEVISRGRHIREILNKSSGGNFVHKEM